MNTSLHAAFAEVMQHDFQKFKDNHPLTGGPDKTQEGVEMSLWDKWEHVEYPDTFSFLELAKDSGFSEVKSLYTPSRWLSAAVLVVFVLYNVEAVIKLDMDFINHPNLAAAELGTTLGAINKFYFSREIIATVAPLLGYEQDQLPSPVKVIGFLELIGLSYFLLNFVYCCLMVAVSKGFRRWYAVQSIFWDILPTLSVYSAMRLLYSIVPAVLSAKVGELIANLQERQGEGKSVGPPIFNILLWILQVVFSFVVGFDTFLMKLRIVSAAAKQDDLSLTVALSTVQFLVQVLGVVQLGPFVRKRLFLFIFGGEDGVMQEEEFELMEVWNCLLAKRIYRENSFSQFIAVMASFSDVDFQSLVVNENIEAKNSIRCSN